ncbi:MAG: MFS transporter [Alphaproteobacteria bacterium]|nr:MFS transporter [Alphaproteobacteria bacterium]
MNFFSSLNRNQKEAIGLLQIGTFLEYFDLMLYIHMAVLLNELFFPKTDPHTAALLSAFAFCSTYVMRPIGALIFGWLGDNIGRKSTIIITTLMMSVSCVIMANLPTYAQVGISAAWIMTFCRIAQGMSSLGEIVGAQIYVSETTPRPLAYPAVGLVSIACSLGGTAALGLATLVTSFYLNWRLAFWMGAGIALVGAVARTRLRETPDFLKMKRQKIRDAIAELTKEDELSTTRQSSTGNKSTWKESIKLQTLLAYFFIHCGYPLSFYLGYIYFNPMLKDIFEYSAESIIVHNFYLSMFMVFASMILIAFSCKVHPLKILKIRWIFTFLLMAALPFLIININTSTQLFCVQALILTFSATGLPADAVFYYHLPIFRRFTFASFLYALSRALMYAITSFGLVYLGSSFGSFGLWFITLPITLGYLYGILHFIKLERGIGIYPNLSIQSLDKSNLNSLNKNDKMTNSPLPNFSSKR